MRGSRHFFTAAGGGSRLYSLDNVSFSPQLILQRGSNGFITVNIEKTILFQGSRGGPTFSRWGGGIQLFPGGGGVQMLISIEAHITCDFPGGVRAQYPPSGSALVILMLNKGRDQNEGNREQMQYWVTGKIINLRNIFGPNSGTREQVPLHHGPY